MRVAAVTQIPSPYQIELFDAVHARGVVQLDALYLDPPSTGRSWRMRALRHDGIVVDSAAAESAAELKMEAADLVVFGDYTYRRSRGWMARRAASGRRWCFWGERPGVHLKGALGALLRRLRLASLHQSKAPIWGIGGWALEGYRAEFGDVRSYFNVPYFSDLGRFSEAGRARRVSGAPRRILFSGSLIRRKGVDILAAAFARFARGRHGVELALLGDGLLRQSAEKTLAEFSGRVHFHGFRDWDELPGFYGENDILCVPSRYDGWGLVVPEGLAAGMPVIATTQMGAARELIVHGENGWLVPPGNVGALEEALVQAVAMTPERRAAMQETAVRSVADHQLADGARRFEEAALQSFNAGT